MKHYGRSIILVFLILAIGASCSSPGASPTPTMEPTKDTIETQDPIEIAYNPVVNNSDWEPVIETIDGVEMALVPTGCFMMGIEDGYNPMVVHEQCIDQPYWIDVYEVTNAIYGSSGSFVGQDYPRENVTWFEAVEFCRSRGARLPSEVEWEYAARGPDNLYFPWGDTFLADNVVYAENSETHPINVGSKPDGASWVGAHDLCGNVAEWVSSCFSPYPYNSDDGREDLDNTEQRVIRGGAFPEAEELMPVANRTPLLPSQAYNSVGFRCVRSIDGEVEEQVAAGPQTEAEPTAQEPAPIQPAPTPLPAFSSDGEWERRGYMDTKKYAMPVVQIGELIYIPGGAGDRDGLEVFDPVKDSWELLAGLPANREHHMAVAFNGVMYVFGGSYQVDDDRGQNLTWAYDPEGDKWFEKAEMPEPRFRGDAVAMNGSIYILGGLGGSDAVLQYDPPTDSWTTRAPLGEPRWGHEAVSVDGKVYVIGGSVSSSADWLEAEIVETVRVYDPVTDTWSDGPPLPEPRFGHSVMAYKDKILVCGGGEVVETYLKSCFILDIATGEWEEGPTMPAASAWGDMALVGETLYLIGGTARPIGKMESVRPHGRILVYAP